MAGPEVPFPWSVRYTDRLFRLPEEQRAHVVAKAKERIARDGRRSKYSKRDRAIAALAGTVVGNG